jgi:thioredoxin-related protein
MKIRNKLFFVLSAILLVGTFSFYSFKPNTVVTAEKAELEWKGWNEGYELAKKKKKYILIDVYTDWCGWCKRMDKDTYEESSVVEFLKKDFVAVKFNPELKESYKIGDDVSMSGRELYNSLTGGKSSGYPTTIILDPNANAIIGFQPGYMKAPEFKKWVTASVESSKNNKK